MDRRQALLDQRAQKLRELHAKHKALSARIPPNRVTIKRPSPVTALVVPPVVQPVVQPVVPLEQLEQTIIPVFDKDNRATRIKFFFINLDRAEERRSRMVKQLSDRNIRFERVVAIDGSVPNALLDFVPVSWRGGMLNAFKCEIATTISHLKAIYQFVQSGEPVGIILEDDAVFEYESKWPYASLDEVIDGAPKNWELITLSITTSDNRLYDEIMRARRRYHHRKSNFYSAVAYAITRQHGINMLARFHCPLDSANFSCKLNGNAAQMQSEINVLGVGPNRYFLYPPAFTYPTDNNSYIHPNHIQGHKNCKAVVSRAYDESDPLYFMPTK